MMKTPANPFLLGSIQRPATPKRIKIINPEFNKVAFRNWAPTNALSIIPKFNFAVAVFGRNCPNDRKRQVNRDKIETAIPRASVFQILEPASKAAIRIIPR